MDVNQRVDAIKVFFECGIGMIHFGDIMCPNCGHLYCYKELERSMDIKKECPYCRLAIGINEMIKVPWISDLMKHLDEASRLLSGNVANTELECRRPYYTPDERTIF